MLIFMEYNENISSGQVHNTKCREKNWRDFVI